ncbi:MAG: PhoH family protein [Selenomonadales bacterium]|nr:PhoH family protein [Selenomonadales bacterium]
MVIEGKEVKLIIRDNNEAVKLFGLHDENLRAIEAAFPVRLFSKDNEMVIAGAEQHVFKVEQVIKGMLEILRSGGDLGRGDVTYLLRLAGEGQAVRNFSLATDVIVQTTRGKQIRPKTAGQKRYLDALRAHDIVFGIGPAGTGKTYLAMAHAVAALKAREVSRLVLTRPAVEAGESLGFLPGDLQEKVDPYLRPLYDALYDIMGVETFAKHMEKGIIEVAPLAYMRGRTLDDAYVILDEAQNTTPEQMKMFLTRLGFGSRAVVTGDLTQADLPRSKVSGLMDAKRVLTGIEGIAFVFLSHTDVIRHVLVQKIIQAYEVSTKQEGG